MRNYRAFNWFTKITAWPVQALLFRTKVHYENKEVQGRRVKGKAIIVCNHTSVYDYAVLLFVFFGRTLRTLMAEVLYEKPGLKQFLTLLGGIRVDRGEHSMYPLYRAEKLLNAGGTVLIFPESRLALPGEPRPLPYKEGAAWLALATGAPIIPVYTNGSYFRKKRAEVIIGEPIVPEIPAPGSAEEKNAPAVLTERIRNRVIALGEKLENISH